MRLYHLVSPDLGLFGPVGFVVVFETRVNVGRPHPNPHPPPSPSSRHPRCPLEQLRDGNIQGLTCMPLLLQPCMCAHLEVFSCTLVIC